MEFCRSSRLLIRRFLETPQQLREQLATEAVLLRELAGRGGSRFSVPAAFLWEYRGLAVVLGRHSTLAEVNLPALQRMGAGLLRRETGGCAVVLQPGIVCCSVLVSGPARWPAEWQVVHERLGELVQRSLAALGVAIGRDDWGDFRRGDRKVGGTARRDMAGAMLWHASLICDGPIERFDQLLRHPPREPAYRRGRKHSDFVDSLRIAVSSVMHALHHAFGQTDLRSARTARFD